MLALLRHSLAMLRNVKLVALHLVVNAVLLVSASSWLLIPEAHIWQLLFAAISAMLIVVVSLWLHSGTLAYAVNPAKENFRASFTIKFWRMFWLLLGAFLLLWCMNVVSGWMDSQWQIAGYIYSKAPTWLRPTAGSDSYTTTLDYCFSILYWYVLPCVLLPIIAARIAGAGFVRGLRILAHWQYWLGMAVAVLLGVWGTKLIMGWMPGKTVTLQTVSLVTRFTLSYVIATAAWLLATGVVGYFLSSGNTAGADSLAPIFDRIAPAGGETRSIVQHSIAVIRDRRLIILQLVTDFVAALMARWNPGTVTEVWSQVVAIGSGVLLLFGLLWVYSGTLAYAVEPVATKFHDSFRFRWRRILWLFAGLVALIVLQEGSDYLLWKLNTNDQHFGLISRITGFTSDYLMPCIVLPWAAVKIMGQPFRDGLIAFRSWRYWLGMVVIIYLAQWISDELLFDHSTSTSFSAEIAGVLLRTLSILPLVIGWVAAAGLVTYFLSNRAGKVVRQPAL